MSLSWGGKTKSIDVYWFQYESDPARNSNVYQVASKAVCDHFPGEFGSERLVQQVVDHILRVTENKEGMEQVSGHHPSDQAPKDPPQDPDHTPEHAPEQNSPLTDTTSCELTCSGVTLCNAVLHLVLPASKIILTGQNTAQKLRTLHKEELTMSNSERSVKKRVEDNARVMQTRRKSPQTTPTSKSPPSSKTTPTSKSPPSPIPKPPTSEKRIRVTSSDGRTCNLKLAMSVTYVQLQEAIEQELK